MTTPGFKIRLTYQEIAALFQKKSCQLLTTETEYDEKHLDKSSYYTFLATCGHERTTTLHNMRRSEIWICKSCSTKQMADKKRGNSGNNYDQEDGSFKYVTKLLGDEFDIVKGNDGVKVDMLVKPKHVSDDAWLQIQLKSTLRARPGTSQYVFSINGCDYGDMLVVCVCVVDDKIWVIDPEILTKNIYTLNITDKKISKYDKYRVNPDKFLDHISGHCCSDRYVRVTSNIARQVAGLHLNISDKYRKLRENHLDFLEFVYPNKSNQVYDFMINGYKVQEKSTSYYRDNFDEYATINLTKSNYGKGTKLRPYNVEDNDYYWLHMPDMDTFYIIPNVILEENEYLSGPDTKGLTAICLYPHRNRKTLHDLGIKTFWASDYLYKYSNLDIPLLLSNFFNEDDISP